MERVYTAPLLDKLGIRPGMRVAIVGDLDDDETARSFRAELAAALPGLRARIRPNGAIWIISRKGKAATLRDVDVIAAATEHGLVDNKVVSFSPTRTALRLVIPVALRPRA